MHILVSELTEHHQHQALTSFINLFVMSVNRVKAATDVFNNVVFWVFTLLCVGTNVSYKFAASFFMSEVRVFLWPYRCYCCFTIFTLTLFVRSVGESVCLQGVRKQLDAITSCPLKYLACLNTSAEVLIRMTPKVTQARGEMLTHM